MLKSTATLGQLLADVLPSRPDRIAKFNGKADPIRNWKPEDIDRLHLGGTTCLLMYPLDAQNRVKCSCVDVDDHGDNPEWKQQVEKIYHELVGADLHPLVEVSQSGEGAHVWLSFSDWLPAWLVRRWWKRWETRIGFALKEINPKQDRHDGTGKGAGSGIRYPLWNKSHFADVEDDWSELDPIEALEELQRHRLDEADLRDIARKMGFPELRQDVEHDDGDLPELVRRLVDQENTPIGRLWRGATSDIRDGGDKSGSGIEYQLALRFAWKHIPEDDAVSAILYWQQENGLGDKSRRVKRSVKKAYRQAAESAAEHCDTDGDGADFGQWDCSTANATGDTRADQTQRRKVAFVPVAELLAEATTDTRYVVDQLVPAGGFCLLCSRPKVGKSTMARDMMLAICRGEPYIGFKTEPVTCLYLCLEDIRGHVQAHFRDMEACEFDNIFIETELPMVGGNRPFPKIYEWIRNEIERTGAGLLVIDTLGRIIECKEFNSYSDTLKATQPLINMARETGCAILALHHNKKVETSDGDDVLGSTLIWGAVDSLITLRRKDNERTISTTGRYCEDIDKRILTFDPQTRRFHDGGCAKQAHFGGVKQKVIVLLRNSADSWSKSEIQTEIGHRGDTVRKAIDELVREDLVIARKEGKSHHPRYKWKGEPVQLEPVPIRPDASGTDVESRARSLRRTRPGSL